LKKKKEKYKTGHVKVVGNSGGNKEGKGG
jgi:hypothetical protein